MGGKRRRRVFVSAELSPEQEQKLTATARVLQGEDPEAVARDLGLPLEVVNRTADDLIGPDRLKPVLESMAADYGLVARGGVLLFAGRRIEVLPT